MARSKRASSSTEAIDKYSQCLQAWKKVHLSLQGKATVVRTYALPKLRYATNLERPSLTQFAGFIENTTNWFLSTSNEAFVPARKYRALMNIDIHKRVRVLDQM